MRQIAGRSLALWWAFCVCAAWGQPVVPPDHSATLLRAQHMQLLPQLGRNDLQLPLIIRSEEAGSRIVGEVFALVDYPVKQVSSALTDPQRWCDIMILHINTKYCRARVDPTLTLLTVFIGKKTPQALTDAQRIDFTYRVASTTPEYFSVSLDAGQGPMGTSNYRIVVEAVSLSAQSSFLHLTYAYSINMLGRVAMNTYVASAGRNKVGFTRTDSAAAGPPAYVGGLRGMVERNTMRYYLAILAYLQSAQLPEAARADASLGHWFASTERYARQLHEAESSEYLAMKRAEILRQKAGPP